ncbi:family 75 glycoside hydrolase [Mariannaea sp. PMI_226]|nr:family 75 glycoside hydrolase [Mariannaea sp. PMI_226]
MPILRTSLVVAATTLLGLTNARDVPTNVKNFYSNIVSKGSCSNKLATGFYSTDGDSGKSSYCGDHIADYNVVYLQGVNGALVNMDIDCDGIQGSAADDGRCGSSGDTQSMTSFMDTVASYGQGVKDLDANVHPYVVFGNTGSKKGYVNFDPQHYGIEPLSVMAVVCGDKLIYGIWGDENGDDGKYPMVGEASISLATACFGKGMNGNAGHDGNDVLYIAFPGSDAVPGAKAKWNAGSYAQFEASIQSLGDKLISRIGNSAAGNETTGGSSGGSSGGSNGGSSNTCSWVGHCKGAPCSSENDCSDDLICTKSKCAAP